jgi:enoyl-CoA hydratase/carnithine racemase
MIFLSGGTLASALSRVLDRRECAVAFASGAVSGEAAAALLHSDWAAVTDDAMLAFDTPDVWSGALWRIGRAAMPLLVSGSRCSAADGRRLGLVDAIVASGTDPLQWLQGWMAGRSERALDSAASLIRRRGGDPLERAEFARMFGVGEPQVGLAAFLGKTKPQWRNRDEG